MSKRILSTGAAVLLAGCGGGGTEPIGPNPNLPVGVSAVNVGVGGLAQFGGGTVVIPGSGLPGSYLVIPTNANSAPDVFASIVVRGDSGTATRANVRFSVTPPDALLGADSTAVARMAPATRFESRLRAYERSRLSLAAARTALSTTRAVGGRGNLQALGALTQGQVISLNVPSQKDPCKTFATVQATVQYVSQRAVILQDNLAPAGGFTATDFKQIGDEFDAKIYATGVTYFGSPSDVNSDGKILMLFTPEINKFTPAAPPGTKPGYIAGFFFAGDLFPSSGTNSCAESNVAEIFYLLAPDPLGTINTNARSTTSVRQGTRGTIAHEFEHMINAGGRVNNPAAKDFEDVWLDEGLAHMAEDEVGRAQRGFTDTQNLTFQDVYDPNNQSIRDDFNAFFYQNLARYQLYLKNPPISGATSAQADSSLAVRGASWSFLRYAADQYAPSGVAAFTRALTAGPQIGVANFTSKIAVPFDSVVVGWMVANAADDAGISGLNAKYTFRSWNMRSAESGISQGQYPLMVSIIASPAYSLPLRPNSATGAYLSYTSSSNQPLTIRFQNSDAATAANFPGARLLILRTQ